MQAKNLDFQKKKIGALSIIETMIRRLNLHELLQARIGHERYEHALCLLIKNILVDHCALYAIQRWARSFEPALAEGKNYSDDTFGRTLVRLAKIDRASLQTAVILQSFFMA